ncbi:NTP transferase domain-containing protein [Tichowtungia aerotolerans]|uniref:NTP transferase domain-containing protein n=1 Tax=Tichowtungia aerotolerans TaxID=2697043 RepID=A0A6P1M7Q6_9BACT|nr:NTP transferase domain-containing protein [Tichowtungia aerotolerans]QHI68574.1 NTP transferase domain-containing protein [Tichowtungia aerotolerans]
MDGQKKVNAVVLAGDRRASIQVKNDNKAFLLLKNTPLLIHILRAFKQARFVHDITVIGPAERIREIIGQYADTLEGPGKIRVIEQRQNMIENFKAAYVDSLGLPQSTAFETLSGSEHADTPVLASPCDIPLLTSWEIDEFLMQSNMHDYDYSIGITSEKVLRYYHPSGNKPGIRMIYFHVREDLMRQNNLHLARPLKLKHLDYIEKMYEWRYQTHLLNVLRMMSALLLFSWRFLAAIKVFTFLQISLYYDRHGHPRLADRLRMHAPLHALPEGIGRIIGARTQVVYTHLGGAALDVDHDENLEAMEAMYDDWMEHQSALRQKRFPRVGKSEAAAILRV